MARSDLIALASVCPLGGKELSASDTPLLPIELPRGLGKLPSLPGLRPLRRQLPCSIQKLAQRDETLTGRAGLVDCNLLGNTALK